MTKAIGKFTNSSVQAISSLIPVSFTSYSMNCPTIALQNGAILLKAPGVYEISANFDVLGTAADAVSISLLENGNEVSGASGTTSIAAIGDYGNISFTTVSTVKRTCCCSSSSYASITFTANAATTLSNANVIVKKIG